MNAPLRRKLYAGILSLVLASATAAVAYFTTTGSGQAAGSASTLSSPGSVAASTSPPKTTVTWNAATINPSTAATSYAIERYDSSGTDLGAASCSPVSSSSGVPDAFGSFSCTDTPGAGTFKYKATAKYNSSWTATSGFTNTVRVTATTVSAPPTGTTSVSIAASSIASTLSGAAAGAGGTITFKVFGPQTTAPATCASGGTTVGTASASGNGTYHPGASFTPSSAGTYWWYASYGGDTGDPASSSTCGSGMTSTAVTNATTTSGTGPANGTAGTTIATGSISSTLAGGTTSPTVGGTITFAVFGPQTTAPTSCTSGGITVGTASVSGNGTYHPSASFTPQQTGTYWWYASYGGDTYNSVSSSTCGSGMASTTVAKASPTATASAPSSGTAGTAIAASSLSSTLSSSTTPASGTITFKVFGPQATAPATCTSGGTTIGTSSVSGPGTYSPSASYTPTTVGTYWWYASYNGDGNNNASNSTCGTGMTSTVVGKASPTNTVAAPSSNATNTTIAATSISATIAAGASPTGTVTFKVFGPQSSAPTTCTSGGTNVGAAVTVNGNGTYNPSAGFKPSQPGTYWWYASYGGDANNNAATGICNSSSMTSTIVKTTTAVTGTGPNTATAGTAIATNTITSKLTGGSSPTGTITFIVFGPQATAPTDCSSGGTTVGSATVSGNATYHPTSTYTPEAVGTYWWYASYGGDTNNSADDSGCGSGMSSTTVSMASPTTTVAAPATNATDTAIDPGSVTATLANATTPATGTLTFKVFGPQTSAPTTCTTGGTILGTAPVTGAASYNPSAGYTPTSPGTYWWYASYNGDANNNASVSTCGGGMTSTVVKNATTATISAPGASGAGSAIATSAISATLSGGTSSPAASGTIGFKVFGPQSTAPSTCTSGGTTVGGNVSVSGNGTYHPSATFTPNTAGTYWWYVSYNGDTNNSASNSGCGSGMTSTNVWSATAAAAAADTSAGNSTTTSSFAIQASTTYLLLVFRNSSSSDGISSISSTGLSPALTTSSFTQVAQQNFNTTGYEWAYWVTTSGSASGTGTLKLTFNKTLGGGQDTVLSLVAISGNDLTAPVVTSNVSTNSGAAGTAATANLPNSADSHDAGAVWLGATGALGASAPSATGLTAFSYANNSAGSAGLYGAIPAQQNSSFGTLTPAWGTLAFELGHG